MAVAEHHHQPADHEEHAYADQPDLLGERKQRPRFRKHPPPDWELRLLRCPGHRGRWGRLS
ncbi:hypothetical protein C7I55_18035 [Sphingomonas deserti]|uniref:Uncharacterized protein n=2 Tax=Allosphingosinicella deserti TaxID=2116704 RepID=A0A2P7QK94_9SPHN|nr:hypothetical protein C7I55_18035 [Sphingomonas deserti]